MAKGQKSHTFRKKIRRSEKKRTLKRRMTKRNYIKNRKAKSRKMRGGSLWDWLTGKKPEQQQVYDITKESNASF